MIEILPVSANGYKFMMTRSIFPIPFATISAFFHSR